MLNKVIPNKATQPIKIYVNGLHIILGIFTVVMMAVDIVAVNINPTRYLNASLFLFALTVFQILVLVWDIRKYTRCLESSR